MLRSLRTVWTRGRQLNLRIANSSTENRVDRASHAAVPTGAFAALLAEWKQAQMRDVADEEAEPKSA